MMNEYAIEVLKEELQRLQGKEPKMWTADEMNKFNEQIDQLLLAISKLQCKEGNDE